MHICSRITTAVSGSDALAGTTKPRVSTIVKGLGAHLAAIAVVAVILISSQRGYISASFNAWELAALQGALAAGFGLMFGLAWWWLPINLFFLPAVLSVRQVQVPGPVYLAGFLVLLLFNWGVLHTRVPLYLSRRSVWKQVAALLPEDRAYALMDIGSGLGGMLLYLDQARPLGMHKGVEISPAPWLISRVRAALQGARAIFKRQDYREIDLSAYDVVFAFLSPIVMQELVVKARREMRPGSLLLSLAFPLPDVEHDFVVQTGKGKRQILYGWRVRTETRKGEAHQVEPTVATAAVQGMHRKAQVFPH